MIQFSRYLSLLSVFILSACTATNEIPPAPTFEEKPPNDTVIILSSLYNANIADTFVYTFEGQVIRGEPYQQEIAPELLFCLLPIAHADYGWVGWRVTIAPTIDDGCNTHDYVGLVSPPFYGLNPVIIEGWHFRNENNTGSNDGSVNAPQENRWFNFVLSESDYRTVRNANSCIYHNNCENGLTLEVAYSLLQKTPKTRGSVMITSLELGNLVPGQTAWIETMTFAAQFYLPVEMQE